jgi:subtilisin family serine protease
MKKPTILVGNYCFAIFFFLIFLFPLHVCAQENSVNPVQTLTISNGENLATAEIFPAETITIPITAANEILGFEKNTGLTNSSNLSQKKPNSLTLVNEKHKDFITDTRTGRKYIKDRVIVRFKSQKNTGSSISQEKISLAHAKVGARIEKDLSVGSVAGLQLVQLPNGTDVQSAITAYESNPDVLYAEPDYMISIIPDQPGSIVHEINSATILSLPNDANFSYQWSFHNTGQAGGTPGADINAPAAWDISTGSNSVVVAVIDTGVLYTHSDLSPNIWDNTDELPGNGIDDDHNGYIDDVRGWNFVNSSNNPIDDQEHGTHVSGTIGAVGNNAIGVAGVNWQVKIMPLKAFNEYGEGNTSDAILAIEYANANGASIISNSWGGGLYDQGLKDVIDASPAVVVCAAGNSGINIDDNKNPVYPAGYSSANIISVAATDNKDLLADFSNFGTSSVDLAAPGTNIWSTNLDGNYTWKSGTSMATPHVSGVAALVKSVNPRLSALQIKNIILNNVDVKSSLSGKVNTSGRLNAYTAVMAAQRMAGPDKIGVYSNGSWYLDHNGDGVYIVSTDNAYGFGAPDWTPAVGDWNGDGRDKIGVNNDGRWYLDYNGNGVWENGIDKNYYWGTTGDTPVANDWNGDGKTEIGIFRNGYWWLDNNGNGVWDPAIDKNYYWGTTGDTPVANDWNGDGKTEIGIFRNGYWWLDNNGNGVWDPAIDKNYCFGGIGYIPGTGKWS